VPQGRLDSDESDSLDKLLRQLGCSNVLHPSMKPSLAAEWGR
jgi:hypothetical protein